LWNEKDIDKILEARKNILTLLDNKTKNLDFLPENKLTLAFQKKIILNNRYSKYFKWFDIAEKSRNKNNTKKDFALYEKDKILMAVMQRIRKDTLKSKDYSYIKDLDGSYERGVELGLLAGIEKGIEQGIEKGIEQGIEKGIKQGIEKGIEQGIEKGIEQGIEKGIEKGIEQGIEKGIEKGIEQGIEQGRQAGIEQGIEIGESKKTKETVILAYLEGFSDAIIAKLTKLPVNEVEIIIEEYKVEQEKKN
jgi:hypothetical protein